MTSKKNLFEKTKIIIGISLILILMLNNMVVASRDYDLSTIPLMSFYLNQTNIKKQKSLLRIPEYKRTIISRKDTILIRSISKPNKDNRTIKGIIYMNYKESENDKAFN